MGQGEDFSWYIIKVTGKGQYICTVPYCKQPTFKALGYGNTLSRNLTVLPAHPHVYPRIEWTIPAFALEGWVGLGNLNGE